MKTKLTILIALINLQCLAASTVDTSKLYGAGANVTGEEVKCRTMPFYLWTKDQAKININTSADAIYFLGMVNFGWDSGIGAWGFHLETTTNRKDQIYIGAELGNLKINYEDKTSDTIPLIFGVTIWSVDHWAHSPGHHYREHVKEPFASRPEYAEALANCLKLKENECEWKDLNNRRHFFLSVKPQNKKINSIAVTGNPDFFGTPGVTGITLDNPASTNNLVAFGKNSIDKNDLACELKSNAIGDWKPALSKLAKKLYTDETDLPKNVKVIDYPKNIKAAKLLFKSKKSKNIADMLSCIWIENMTAMEEKFNPDTGFFHESGKNAPFYGSYDGIGTWAPVGVYNLQAFPRCSDHYASLVLRCVENPKRLTTYVDFCDKWVYFYRDNHDPKQGPPNAGLIIERYPTNLPHWGFVMNGPLAAADDISDIHGAEETDGHGSTIVGRWLAWRHKGAPTDEWMTEPRSNIYGKSRWDTTRDTAEFLCWLMDYTERDVMWCEGETTGWGGGGNLFPKDMEFQTNRAKIVENFKKANMYEPYPSYVCLTALKCAAEMADAMKKPELAERWEKYSKRIRNGMLAELTTNWNGKTVWRRSPHSVYPSFQDSLVQAWFSIYFDGLDPNKFDPELTKITRNTLERQLAMPAGHKQVHAMGYGQGWLAKAVLILDEMDNAGPLLYNMAKYNYDKNMDFENKKLGIDWKRYQWRLAEGVNIMPDGSWHRINDLGNGANQGIAMHAIELCAGIDDANPNDLKIIPRVPAPLSGLDIEDFPVLIPKSPPLKGVDAKRPGNVSLTRANINYSYKLKPLSFNLNSDKILPTLSVRLGPFTKSEAKKQLKKIKIPQGAKTRIDKSGHYKKKDAYWIWVEGMKDIKALKLI